MGADAIFHGIFLHRALQGNLWAIEKRPDTSYRRDGVPLLFADLPAMNVSCTLMALPAPAAGGCR